VSTTFSHIGLCVTDLDRSVRFYVEGLGFEAAESWTIGAEYGALMELPGVELTSQFLRRDGNAIELLHYRSPGVVGPAERRPVNQLGLTHLCFRVDDVDAVAARLTALGGTVHEHTRTTFPDADGNPQLDFVYCTDPDGTRIELMRLPG
jgi:catechol 2,3-dioxygenase-like lactoylglutathione lyase family enzyme